MSCFLYRSIFTLKVLIFANKLIQKVKCFLDLIFVAYKELIEQYVLMLRLILNLLCILAFLLSFWFFVTDRLQQKESSTLLGEVWYNNSPSSLQLAEAIIDRYIDPCSLISILGCPSFLWHPTISSALQLSASLFFFALGVFILLISKWLPRRRGRRLVYDKLWRDGRR